MRQTQLVPDVHACPHHIACASSTQSELVVPVLTADGDVLAVLDLDSGAGCGLWTRGGGRLGKPATAAAPPACSLESDAPATLACPAPAAAADLPAAFTQEDARWVERLCGMLGARPWATGL